MKKFSKNNWSFLLLICSAMPFFALAQGPPCGFDAAMQAQFQQNPSYENAVNQFNQSYSQNPSQGQGPTDGTYEIPTVVHIIHNNGAENISDAQVHDAISQANNQLAGGEGGFDTKIRLVLAKFDKNGNCMSGINRVQYAAPDADLSSIPVDIAIKNLSRQPVENYLNIWIVRKILPDNPGQTYAGYAYLPSADPLVDGIVIRHNFFGTTGTASGNELNTLAHEFGHYVSLYHVWGPDFTSTVCENCHVPADCLNLGDRVCDTDPCNGSLSSGDCSPYVDPCGPNNWNCLPANPNSVYPRENYMSYAHACQYRFTQGQAERMYFALDNFRPNLWTDTNQRCTGIAGFEEENKVIDTNTSWTTANLPNNGNITINGDLTIESGAKLTIGTGVVVHFCGNARLIIKPNATLDLSGTLTNGCGEPWKGVEVWGNSAASQFTLSGVNAQGRLTCKNGSVIENADIGVQLWGPDESANAGGIISCSGTTFRNNRISVKFAPYNNFWPFQVGPTGQVQNYSGSFGRCTFITAGPGLNPLGFEAFLYMKGVRGINIIGCTFSNFSSYAANPQVPYGYGIYAADAGFSVNSACNGNTYPCTDYTHSEFKRLTYGIYTANVVGNQPLRVQRARFNQCSYGIYNKAVSQGTLLFNQFNLGLQPSVTSNQDQFGVFFEGAMSGFTFQENTFTKTAANVTNTIGSYCKDLGYFDGNMLRRNTYNGIRFANIAEKTNAYDQGFSFTGLHYLCNTNIGVTGADFTVLPSSKIRRSQGIEVQNQTNTFNAAGNKFSHSTVVNSYDFQNQGSFEIRYYKNPNVSLEDPVTVSGNFSEIDANPNTCPTVFCDPPCKGQYELNAIKSDFFVKRNEYNTAKTAYDAAVAGGNEVLAEQYGHAMAAARHAMDTGSFMVTLHLLYDTATFHRDTLLAWFARMDNPAAQLQLARDYLAHGQPAQASATLLQASSLFGLNTEDAADFSDLSDIVNLIGEQSVYSLNAQTLDALDGYTIGDGLEAVVLAQNIRTMYGSHYPPRYQLPGEGGERSSEGNKEAQSNIVDGLVLKASPNPASADVTFTIEGNVLEGNELTLSVTDLNGKLVWSQRIAREGNQVNKVWNTKEIPNGIYVYRLASQNGQYSLTGKIAIQK